MQVAESVQTKTIGICNLKSKMADIAQAVSKGAIRTGQPGTIAVAYDTVEYKIVARYMREVADDPPPTDIKIKEIGTERPVFVCKEKTYALETLRNVLINQNITFVQVETKHPVFWYKEEIYVLGILVDLLIEKNLIFITKTGDGSEENPIIILKWERECRTCALIR